MRVFRISARSRGSASFSASSSRPAIRLSVSGGSGWSTLTASRNWTSAARSGFEAAANRLSSASAAGGPSLTRAWPSFCRITSPCSRRTSSSATIPHRRTRRSSSGSVSINSPSSSAREAGSLTVPISSQTWPSTAAGAAAASRASRSRSVSPSFAGSASRC